MCHTFRKDDTSSRQRIYWVDHGVEELLKQGITPKFAIGDFDSLQNRQTLEKF